MYYTNLGYYDVSTSCTLISNLERTKSCMVPMSSCSSIWWKLVDEL